MRRGNIEPVALTVWILYARQVASSSSSLQPRLSRTEPRAAEHRHASPRLSTQAHDREERGMTALAIKASNFPCPMSGVATSSRTHGGPSIPTREPRGELFTRYEGNPILTAARLAAKGERALQPRRGGVRRRDRYCSCGSRTARASRTCPVACSPDCLTDWVIDPDRSFRPDLESDAERFGIQDPRITRCGDEYTIVLHGVLEGRAAGMSRVDARFPLLRAAWSRRCRPRTRTRRCSQSGSTVAGV